ncbi:MAG: iron chelate uptake ABC transporter family permease subunit, partial [Pseudomonadota bacterium]
MSLTRQAPLLVGLAVAVLALFLLSLLAGRVWLEPAQVLAALTHGGTDLASMIVIELRLPRALLACL